jgi:tryptophan synthase alpha subunit
MVADAVVVGSRIVQEVETSSKEDLLQNINKLMTEIKEAIS